MTQITVPKSAFVPCPMIGFKHRRVSACLGCAEYRGFIDCMPKEPDAAFDVKWRVNCAHPIARRTVSIEVEDDGA